MVAIDNSASIGVRRWCAFVQHRCIFCISAECQVKEHFGHEVRVGSIGLKTMETHVSRYLSHVSCAHVSHRVAWRPRSSRIQRTSVPLRLSRRMTDVFSPLTDVRITLPRLAVGAEERNNGRTCANLLQLASASSTLVKRGTTDGCETRRSIRSICLWTIVHSVEVRKIPVRQ